MNAHEDWAELPEQARDFHRALASLREELEAVDWYHQRVLRCQDETLRGILAHNRDEEIEHACMILEWLRRNMEGWDGMLRSFLFREGEIGEHPEASGPTDLGIRKPRGGEE
jgi:hypothetical protein